MIRIKIGLDWDDVVAPFNSIACKMATKEFGLDPELTINDIESWENTGKASCIKKFYNCQELYDLQTESVSLESIHAVRELMEMADVYFISAVYPQFMSTRAAQIKKAFPEIPDNRIILGGAKDLVQFDIILDDNIDNVLKSPAEYSVLMRKPWNQKMTGLLSVNNLNEFVVLVRHILDVSSNKKLEITEPTVVALVGPSGSGKNKIADYLCNFFFWDRPRSYTTNYNADKSNHIFVPEEYFNKEDYVESTSYAGHSYGTREQEIKKLLETFNVVMPLDMCGAIGMKRKFPTVILYISKRKEELIRDILSSDMDDSEKTLRILSIDAEEKNMFLADAVINNDGNLEQVANKILSMFGRN